MNTHAQRSVYVNFKSVFFRIAVSRINMHETINWRTINTISIYFVCVIFVKLWFMHSAFDKCRRILSRLNHYILTKKKTKENSSMQFYPNSMEFCFLFTKRISLMRLNYYTHISFLRCAYLLFFFTLFSKLYPFDFILIKNKSVLLFGSFLYWLKPSHYVWVCFLQEPKTASR